MIATLMVQTPDVVKARITPSTGWLRRRLGRHTTSGEFIPVIDGLRFVALLPVVLLHVTTGLWVRDPETVNAAGFRLESVLPGQFGLQLFFVLSGFILGIPFARRLTGGPHVNLRRYFLRRLTRIEPPYLLSLTAFLIINPLFGYGTFQDLVPHYLSGLFYAHGLVYQQLNPVNEVAWSLEVEVQFYILMPLLGTVFLIGRTFVRRALLVGAIVAATGLAHALTIGRPLNNEAGEPMALAFLSLPGHLNLFLLGVLIAELFVYDWDGKKPSAIGDVAAVTGLVALSLTEPAFGLERTLMVPISCLLVVVGALRGRFLPRVLELPALFVIGGMCYSVYLLHFGIIRLIGDSITGGVALSPPVVDFWVSTGVLTGLCFLAALVFYVLVERPCMLPDWPERLRGRLLPERQRGTRQVGRTR